MMRNRSRILIIDDQLSPRESIRMVLKDKYDVVAFSEAMEGLNYMIENPVNLVILDINMPKMDGIRVLQEIKRHHPQTKVILLTAYAPDITLHRALNLGAIGYLMKPFDKDELLDIVSKALAG